MSEFSYQHHVTGVTFLLNGLFMLFFMTAIIVAILKPRTIYINYLTSSFVLAFYRYYYLVHHKRKNTISNIDKMLKSASSIYKLPS